MRGATKCAARLKQLVRSLRTKQGKVGRSPAGDVITQMILGIFSRNVPESKAREALDRLRGLVVDYNELRVVPAIEMTEMVGAFPDARLKCEDLSRALNKVFAHEHEVTLDRLRGMSKKEAYEYLEGIDGLDAYSRARVRLLGLQQHAVPLDEAMWAYARKEGIIDRRCSLEEAQAFLERRVPEGEALEFFALVEKQAWTEMGSAVRNGEVKRIASIPPDRTARNMLRLVAAGRSTIVTTTEPDKPGDKEKQDVAGTADADKPAKKSKKAAKPKPVKKKPAKKRKSVRKPRVKAASRPKTKKKAKKKTKKKAKKSVKTKSKPTARRKPKAKKTAPKKMTRQTRRSLKRAKSA